MCLAVPVRVVEILPADMALVEIGGVRNRISLALLDDIKTGDYVIVHTGFAIARLDTEEAEKSLELFAEIAATLGAA